MTDVPANPTTEVEWAALRASEELRSHPERQALANLYNMLAALGFAALVTSAVLFAPVVILVWRSLS
jgi:hypothetical protein